MFVAHDRIFKTTGILVCLQSKRCSQNYSGKNDTTWNRSKGHVGFSKVWGNFQGCIEAFPRIV